MKIKNDNGLLIKEYPDGRKELVPNLMDFGEMGVFEPNGKIDIDPADAKTHNEVLDRMLIEGLDKNCQVGQGGTFYLTKGGVTTFVGSLVAANPIINGQVITFIRNGKKYRGRLQKDADCFNFRRIA